MTDCGSKQSSSGGCCESNVASTCCTANKTSDKYSESRMVSECLEFATAAKKAGRPLIGIMCEYAPREIINACGGVAICLCGGSQKTAEAAEIELSPGICPLIKSTYGYFLEKSNPFLEMADLIVAETTCDGKKKVFELMGREKECYTLELPQLAEADGAKEAWRRQCHNFAAFLERRFGVQITDAALDKAIKELNFERELRLKLSGLMSRKNPPLTGRELLGHNSIISPLPWSRTRLEESYAKYSSITECAGHAGKKRVLLTGVPLVHGAERIMNLIESLNGIVVAKESCTGLKPLSLVTTEAADLIDTIADKYFALPCSVMSPNRGRENLLNELITTYAPDYIIDLSWQGCHTYDLESSQIKNLAAKSGLPYLKIQTDYSTADNGALTTRIEALFEIS